MKQVLLLLRLPEQEGETTYWQTCIYDSDTDTVETEDSGKLPSVRELNRLSSLAENRTVLALVPGAQVTLRQLSVPGRLSNMVVKSLPYRLEEDLAEDVENLHLSILHHHDETLHIALVNRSLMEQWLEWLSSAGLTCHKLLPETLALPITDQSIDLYRMHNYWLVRHGQWKTAVCDDYWLEHYLASINRDKHLNHIQHGSVQEDSNPLETLAAGAVWQDSNLLQRAFETKGNRKNSMHTWRRAAELGCLTLAVWLCINFYSIWSINNQTQQWREESVSLYQELFPGERVIRLIPQMNRKLEDLESVQSHAGLLAQLNSLAAAIGDDKSIKAQLLSYSNSQNTLKVVAHADSMNSFTALRDKSVANHSITLDSISQSGSSVTGVVVVRGAQE